MLVEAQLTPGTQDPAELGERLALIRNGAEHPGDDHRVHRVRSEVEARSGPRHDAHRHRRAGGGPLGLATQVRLRLDRDQLLDARRIVLEVDAVAGADLDHASRHRGQELASQIGLATAAVTSEVAVEDPREEGVLDGL